MMSCRLILSASKSKGWLKNSHGYEYLVGRSGISFCAEQHDEGNSCEPNYHAEQREREKAGNNKPYRRVCFLHPQEAAFGV